MLLGVDKAPPDTRYLIPHGAVQLVLWVCFAVTAGVCEETIFRGYLQVQFSVFTRFVPAGIVISAMIFGVCHIYQGLRPAAMIALYGALYGILAYWRKSVRPGMLAHGHCFRSAGQLVTKVSGSLMDCGRTVFTTNFLPSAETV